MRRPSLTLLSSPRPTSPLSKHLPGQHDQRKHGSKQPTLFGPAPDPAPAPEPEPQFDQPSLLDGLSDPYTDVVDRLGAIIEGVSLDTPADAPRGRQALLANKYLSALTRGAPPQYDYSVSIQFRRLQELGIEPPIVEVEGDPEATAESARAYLRGLPAYAESAHAHEQMVVINPDGSILLDAIHVGHKRNIPNEVEYGDPSYAGTHMLHNHPESVSLSPGDIIVAHRRRVASVEAVHAEGESRMDFDWSVIENERDRRRTQEAVEGWMVGEYRRITEDRSMLFASEELRERVQYGSGHAMALVLADVLPDVVTYTDTSPRPPNRTLHQTVVSRMREELERTLYMRGIRKSKDDDPLPNHTDCMGDFLVGRVEKHMGPGPHPDGTDQKVHGKKGAGSPETQAAPEAAEPEWMARVGAGRGCRRGRVRRPSGRHGGNGLPRGHRPHQAAARD